MWLSNTVDDDHVDDPVLDKGRLGKGRDKGRYIQTGTNHKQALKTGGSLKTMG